jgi:hypothetical protein
MPGWDSSASTLASRAKRSVTWRCSPAITLMATVAPKIESRARNTVPMPPPPTGCSISNLPPSRSPGLTGNAPRRWLAGRLAHPPW